MSYIGNPLVSVAFLYDTFNGNGSTTAFTMSCAPANTASVIVAVSGVVQDPSTYSVIGTTLTFSSAPPSATGNISARYLGIPASGVTTTAYRTITEFTATAGQTTFTPPSYTVGFISVFRNGARLGSADYTATNGTTIVLASGASAGDLIATESFYVSSVLNAIPNTNGAVTNANLAPLVSVAVGGGNTLTVPSVTGTMMVSGNMPAFSAINNTNQTISASVNTKVQFQTKEFDTASCFDNATNYRFTPNVAGYYQVSLAVGLTVSNFVLAMIYKNGSLAKASNYSISGYSSEVTALIYLNGTTDYVEGWIYSGATTIASSTGVTFFQACLIRSA